MMFTSTHPGPRLLRRTVALLALVCGAWAQALALDCPMGLPADASADASAQAAHAHDAHAGHGAHAAVGGSSTSATDDPPTTPSPTSCMLVMGCGATGQVARLASTTLEAPTLRTRTPVEATALASDLLPQEPPPPRLSA